MINGLCLEYAQARMGARMAQRPDERLWRQARSARSVAALLEAVRSAAAAPMVSGIPAGDDADAIELAFRQQWRTRVDEVASWSPEPWRDAICQSRQLCDLPALLQLVSDETPAPWIASDPELARYLAPTRDARLHALAKGPMAPIAAALVQAEAPMEGARARSRSARAAGLRPRVHGAVAAWAQVWRSRWPPASEEVVESLDRIARTVLDHLIRFGATTPDGAAALRQSLAAWLATRVHRATAQPAALFAYLALFALDLERLRGEFVLRARLGGLPS